MNRGKLRYLILAETLDKKIPADLPSFDTELAYGIEKEEFIDQIRFLDREGYITKPLYGDDTVTAYIVNVTDKGERYLRENSGWSKAYKAAKEIRDWIKFFG